MANRQIFRIEDFSGGYNPDQNALDIADNQATDILNLRLDRVGSLVSRDGTQRYIDGYSIQPIQAIGRWTDPTQPNPNLASQVLIKAQSSIERANTSTEEFDDVSPGALDADARGNFYNGQTYTVYANGVDDPSYYTGAGNFKPMGIIAPPPPSLSVGTSSGLSGTFRYAYSYYDEVEGVESNVSDTTIIDLVNEKAIVSFTLPTNPRVTHMRIYRTNAGGAVPLFLTQVTAATTSFTDSGAFALSNLGAVYDNDVPPAFDRLAYVKGYWFGAKGKTLYWSKPNNIDAWPILQSTDVPFEGNDEIRALWSFKDTLIVFGRRNLILVAGQGGQFQLVREDVDLGVVNDRCIVEIEGNLVFLSPRGLRTFPQLQPLGVAIERELIADPDTVSGQTSLLYVPSERALWIGYPGRTYTIHIPTQAISRYSIFSERWLGGGPSGFEAPLFVDYTPGSDGHLINRYAGSVDLARLPDDTDEIRPISVRWSSKVFKMQNPEMTKVFRRIGAFATTGSTGTVTVSIKDANETHPVLLESTGASSVTLWDFVWDTDSWSSEGIEYFIGALPAQTLIGRTVQVDITGDTTTRTEIVSPISLQYREVDRFLGV